MNYTFRKALCDWKNRKRIRKASKEGSKAQLIERAGLRKHLPVRWAEHLSDPTHIRWFPCLPYIISQQLPVAQPLLAALGHSFFHHVH